MWPVAKSGKPKAKRMRPLGFNDQRSPLSRGPSGLPRSGKSGKNRGSTFVERPVTYRCALLTLTWFKRMIESCV